MKKILVISATLLAFAAPAAFGGGLDIAWNNCAFSGGVANVALPCAAGVPITRMYGSFFLDAPQLGVTATDMTLDLENDAAALQPFWNFKTSISPAGCNDGLTIGLDHDPAFSFAFCAGGLNMWGDVNLGDAGNGVHGTAAVGFKPLEGGPNRGRIVATAYRAASNATDLAAAQNYIDFVLVLNAFRSDTRVPAGPCSGCAVPTAIVWNQMNISTLASNAEAIIPVTGPGQVSNCATAGGGTSLCGATPTQSKTWGALKSLYR